MSWDEAFANRYEEWSAHMTDDIAFYVELARRADGPLVDSKSVESPRPVLRPSRRRRGLISERRPRFVRYLYACVAHPACRECFRVKAV
jgi:hypothetical protein